MNCIYRILTTALIFSFLCLTGCATTQQASTASRSGFLGNYSMLKPGEGDQALLVYKNPNAGWSRYKRVMIDPVSVYMAPEAGLMNDSSEERRSLVTYFNAALREELKKNFVLTESPGPDVLRIRIALTDGDQSEVLLDTISTIMPIGLALSSLKRVTVGKDTAVGFAQAEADLLDSQSGARLAAAVDKRYGTKALRSKFGSWNHAKEAMDHWSEQIAARLVEWGAGFPEK